MTLVDAVPAPQSGVGGHRRGEGDRSRRRLQVALTIIGSVATGFGSVGVVKGAPGVLGGGRVPANVDSELRFFAAWYAALGVLVLRAARRPEAEAAVVRTCGARGFSSQRADASCRCGPSVHQAPSSRS